ncbi:MAG: hypothetical protein J5677_04920 [Bacteroidales bacterium]|nr:hypothetical protein [Bacteroidales bacterium]
MKKTILFTLGIIALQLSALGQLIPLSHDGGGPLWLDADKVYNYNQYEKSRWGLGLQWGWMANEIDTTRYGWDRLSAGAYTGYGYADQRFKWGVNVSLWGNPKLEERFYLSFIHDLTPDALHTLASPGITVLSLPASFMTRLYSDTWRLTLGFSQKRPVKKIFELFYSLELHLSRERLLYDIYGQIQYPTYDELKDMEASNFAELQLTLFHSSGWSGRVTFGSYNTDTDKNGEFFLRTLVQYERKIQYDFLEFQIYGQGGFVEGTEVPYSRRFDLGGSWGCPLALNHTLLSARPNEFTANCFVLFNLKLTTRNPLFEFFNNIVALGTAPKPFVLCNGAWGKAHDYPAPEKGIAEVGAGIDGLLRWGEVYWGLGVVYRLTPASAPYHFTDSRDNMTILFSAYLDLYL